MSLKNGLSASQATSRTGEHWDSSRWKSWSCPLSPRRLTPLESSSFSDSVRLRNCSCWLIELMTYSILERNRTLLVVRTDWRLKGRLPLPAFPSATSTRLGSRLVFCLGLLLIPLLPTSFIPTFLPRPCFCVSSVYLSL